LTVDELHAELEFDLYTDQLQCIAGVWKALKERQAKARRDPKAMAAYKSYLTRCIHQVRDIDPLFTPDEEDHAMVELLGWMDQRLKTLQIYEREGARWPSNYQAWCEQNLPLEWTNLLLAMTRACERPSAGSVANWKQRYDDMLTRYISGATG
jgi:hypothetical protein